MGRADQLLTLLGLTPSLWGKKKGEKKPDKPNPAQEATSQPEKPE